MRDREMTRGGRRGSKQSTGDSVGREDAGFVNTGRKERKQVGRGLERGE